MGTESKHLKFLVVQNSHHDCLIGTDLLKEATLDGSLEAFSWRDQTLKLLNRRQQLKSVLRARLAKTKTLPPRSETICYASVPGSNLQGKQVVFEPCNVLDSKSDFHNCYICLAASINAISRHGVFPVKILNTSQTSVRLQRNTKLGLVSEFDWIEASTNKKPNKPKLVASVAAGMDGVALPEGVTISDDNDKVSIAQRRDLASLIHEFKDVFAAGSHDLTQTNVCSHSVDTQGTTPIKQIAYRPAQSQKSIITKHVKDMLDKNVIEKSSSPWSSPVVLVGKKDGTIRFCIDYRKLNKVTKKDTYPLPRIDETLEILGKAKFASTLDLFSGYWQIPLAHKDKEKTAFVCHEGLFQFTVMPFGLTNAPATFQRAMELVLSGLQHAITIKSMHDDLKTKRLSKLPKF